MSAVPLGTATSAVTRRNSVTQALLQCLPSAFHCEVPRKHVFCHQAYAHLIASVPLGSDVLQGHAHMKGTSCWNECRAIGYCYFGGDKTKFSDTGIAAVFAISVPL